MVNARTASDRVEQLIATMTVEEKLGQITQYFHFASLAPADDVAPESSEADSSAAAGTGFDAFAGQPKSAESELVAGRVGSLLFVRNAADINRLQKIAIENNRHGIPLLFGFDVIHGFRTVFPVPIAMAASWDAELIEAGQAVAAREARAIGLHWAFAPMVDIARDPRWGRIIEGAGEDPLLGSVVAAAQVRGFQGADHETIDSEHVIAGPKHFLGYGAALGGRDYDEADLSEQEIYNTYLPPFRAAIEAGAGNIMAAYMDLNGVPASGNHWLLTDILRDTLDFDGFVVSDANSVRDLATHHYASSVEDAGVRGLNAGVDMEMAVFDASYGHLADAVADGRVSMERLNEAVRRVLTAKERVGLFENPYVDEARAAEVLADPAHRDAARRAAEGAAVLLRNEGSLLPLDAAAVKKVAVLGPLADSARDIIGPWVFDFDLDETVTIVDGLRARLGADAVTYEQGVARDVRLHPSMFDMFAGGPAPAEEFDLEAGLAAAAAAASDADVAIVVVGEHQNMIGENASRSSLSLPGDQQQLIEAVVATGTPVVLLVMNGRPLDICWAAENVPAILDVWYPGTAGGTAVANLLFGDAAPTGRLPFTWVRNVGQVPMHYAITRSHQPENQDKRYWNESGTPLFPFGHGLTYTSFEYRSISVSDASVALDGTVTVTVEVANTGARDGVETVQLYLHQLYGTSSRPMRLLAAFERVAIAAGETASVTFEIGPDQRRYWSSAPRDWVLDETTFEVYAGPDATADLTATFTTHA